MASRTRGPAGPANPADLSYRPCVGIMLINRAGLVFVGRRRSEAGPEHVGDGYAWQMPQGGIDPGESPREALFRELYEETNVGADRVAILGEAPDWLRYDLPAAVADRAWRGRYRGQTQRWFALAFEGRDEDIDVHRPGGGRHRAEFDDWRWEPAANLPALVIPFKRGVYEGALAALGHHARPR